MGNDDTASLVEQALRGLGLTSPNTGDLAKDAEILRRRSDDYGDRADAFGRNSDVASGGRDALEAAKSTIDYGAKAAGVPTTYPKPSGPTGVPGSSGPRGSLTANVSQGARGASMVGKVANVASAAYFGVKAVDAISTLLFGYSIVDEWIRKPFVGDWDAMRDGAATWRQLAIELDMLRTELAELPAGVAQWRGEAYDAYCAAQAAASEAYVPAVQASLDIAEALDITAELANTILDIVDNAITLAIGVCQRVAAEQAVPVIGQIVGAIEIGVFALQAMQIAMDVNEALNSFLQCVTLMESVVAAMGSAQYEIERLAR